ncbi:MAG: glycosyltransferase family 1 protein [Anaerolineae bacterium]
MYRIGLDARLAYYQQGGITQYIYQIIHEIARLESQNHYLILHSRRDPRDLTAAPTQQRVTCWTPAHHRLERLALAAELLPHRLDLLHSPDYIPPYSTGFRQVISVHDLTFLRYPQYMTAESLAYYAGHIHDAVRRADHILTDTEAIRTEIIDLLSVPPERVTAIPLGVHARFRPLDQEAIRGTLSRFSLTPGYILFVGTIEPRKNISGLLRAYARLRADLPDLPPLVLAGSRGWLYKDIFRTHDDLGLAGDTRWLHEFTAEDLPALYNGAAVFCLPSFYEGFGFPPLEAMACGVPVVVSNCSSLPEVVGEAGVLIDPNDVDSIADGLRRVLLDGEAAANLRERGLKRAALFQWSRTAGETLAIYRQVLEA